MKEKSVKNNNSVKSKGCITLVKILIKQGVLQKYAKKLFKLDEDELKDLVFSSGHNIDSLNKSLFNPAEQ